MYSYMRLIHLAKDKINKLYHVDQNIGAKPNGI